MFKHRILLMLLCIVCLLFCICACTTEQAEPTETMDPNRDIHEITLVIQDPGQISELENYPNLQTADFTGSTCYEEIHNFMVTHPDISVFYDIEIGDVRYGMDVQELTCAAESTSMAQLLENLQYFTNLTALYLPLTTLSAQELLTLRQTYPEICFDYTVQILNSEISWDVEELDLSGMASDQIEEISAVLPMLPNLADIYLTDEQGSSSLELSDVKRMMEAVPKADVHYCFEFYGQTISTTDETVEYKGKYMGDQAEPAIREVLDILPRCTYFLLDGCNISNDVMAKLRDDYPSIKIVWRVSYANKSTLTDTKVVRCVEKLSTRNAGNLFYCTDVEYMDFGHCSALTDVSFVQNMPNLKVCILGDSAVCDLTPFSSCKNLEYLELVNCNRVKDLTPLSECVSLKGLNLSYVFSVDDLSPLFGLQNLERLFMGRHGFTPEMIEAAREALPNCWVTDHAEPVAWIGFNYSVGWRLDDEHTFADWYVEIMDIFGYTRTI